MNIKILTPEAVIFDGEVKSVQVPGSNGEFHILNNHASIVSALSEGEIKLYNSSVGDYSQNFEQRNGSAGQYFGYDIKGGVVEFKDNKGIILAD